MNFKLVYLIFLSSFLFINCKKQVDVNEGSLLKRTLMTTLNQRLTVDTFLYNSQKRLTGIKYFNTNTKYDIQIEYDTQAKFSKIRYIYLGREDYSCSFIYNTSGQIIKKLAVPVPGFDFANNESYAYDGVGRLISDTTYYKQTDSVLYYMTFKYDNDGNIVENEFRNFINPTNQGKTVYSFDNNPNPYNIQSSSYFYLTGNTSYLNKNNILTSKNWGSNIISNTYEYLVNGVPKKLTTNDPNSSFGGYHYPIEFEYW